MKKSAVLAIIVLCLAISTGVLGFMYSTKGETAAADPNAFLEVGKYTNMWENSAHANSASEAFRHWDKDGEIPINCAKCHASTGLKDFMGVDGTAANVVDNPAKTGGVVDCAACHNEYTTKAQTITFPSGMQVESEAGNVACWNCHQGMQAGINGQLEKKIGTTGLDDKAEGLGFVNPHYLNIAAMYLGSEANGGYQYPEKTYAGRFTHARGVETCTDCHDPHTLHLADPGFAKCSSCHSEVTGWPDQRDVRMKAKDYDGDGDKNEGVHGEIDGLLAELIGAMVLYSTDTLKAPIGVSDNYPYWFTDANGNGTQEEDEKVYADWTPRLMYAAFNYKFVKSSSGYLHNPVYSAQLLIDSIENLAQGDAEIKALNYERP